MRLIISPGYAAGPRGPRGTAYPYYRGTYRAHPTFCESLPKNHEINQLFFWFLEEGGELGLVHDLAKASRYAQLLNENHLAGHGHFEVVQGANGNSSAEVCGRFLGFDITAGYNNSLLWWRLDFQTEPQVLPEPIHELVELISQSYAPKLNKFQLFSNAETASQCLRAMDALQQLHPNLYEGERLRDTFEVVGLYLMSPAI